MEDHFGGTVQLDCKIIQDRQELFSDTTNTIDDLRVSVEDDEGTSRASVERNRQRQRRLRTASVIVVPQT